MMSKYKNKKCVISPYKKSNLMLLNSNHHKVTCFHRSQQTIIAIFCHLQLKARYCTIVPLYIVYIDNEFI